MRPFAPFAGPMPSKFLQAFLVSIFLLHRSSFSRRGLKFALVEPSFGSKNVFHHCFHGVLKFSTAAPTPLHPCPCVMPIAIMSPPLLPSSVPPLLACLPPGQAHAVLGFLHLPRAPLFRLQLSTRSFWEDRITEAISKADGSSALRVITQ